jgi:hypothetical protein
LLGAEGSADKVMGIGFGNGGPVSMPPLASKLNNDIRRARAEP